MDLPSLKSRKSKSVMKSLPSLLTFIALCVAATAEVRVETLAEPMRDSIKLATNIYRDDALSKAPVVLMRTPYDRTKAKGAPERFAKAPQPLQPGEVYEITVDLGPCAATIAKGHRPRVDICGSLFPLYDRNPNTGEGPFGSRTAIATEQVHHRPGALSRIVLPCLQP